MQDTGLNILAITIFTITLSVFIGPIFHLSPAIPATVTFVLLGLVTFDTLGWQNQGVNLLLDLFASPEQKERIIYHEAGHFLTAYLLEIPIIGYTLTPWETLKHKNSGSGGVIFDTSIPEQKKRDLQEFNLIVERVGVVLMGGIAAEKFIYNNSQGGQEDLQKFREIYTNVALKDSNSQLTVSNLQLRQRQAILRSTNLIESNKKSYLALVEAMKERKSVAQCQDIIASNLESS